MSFEEGVVAGTQLVNNVFGPMEEAKKAKADARIMKIFGLSLSGGNKKFSYMMAKAFADPESDPDSISQEYDDAAAKAILSQNTLADQKALLEKKAAAIDVTGNKALRPTNFPSEVTGATVPSKGNAPMSGLKTPINKASSIVNPKVGK